MQTRRNHIAPYLYSASAQQNHNAPFIFDIAVSFIITGTVYLVDRVLNDGEKHF